MEDVSGKDWPLPEHCEEYLTYADIEITSIRTNILLLPNTQQNLSWVLLQSLTQWSPGYPACEIPEDPEHGNVSLQSLCSLFHGFLSLFVSKPSSKRALSGPWIISKLLFSPQSSERLSLNSRLLLNRNEYFEAFHLSFWENQETDGWYWYIFCCSLIKSELHTTHNHKAALTKHHEQCRAGR